VFDSKNFVLFVFFVVNQLVFIAVVGS